MNLNAQKTWISPFIAITALAVAVTGVLMLKHIRLPGMHTIHQWGGLILTIGIILHLLMNWQIFCHHFQKRAAKFGTIAGLILLYLTLLVPVLPHVEVRGDKGPISQAQKSDSKQAVIH